MIGTVRVGNTAVKQGGNQHKWTLYVKAQDFDEALIQSVTLKLHPTFTPSEVRIERPPFEFTAVGWGTFDVGVTVTPHYGETLEVSHQLCFEHPVHQDHTFNYEEIPTFASSKRAAGRMFKASYDARMARGNPYLNETTTRSAQDPDLCESCCEQQMLQHIYSGPCSNCNGTEVLDYQTYCRSCAVSLQRCVCGRRFTN
ncbi:hypothetical protein Pelo_10947 [Pelomyxa schiedti]|nr:hypothetical protein Pelo_10947 [Pelomyxa schiedti]